MLHLLLLIVCIASVEALIRFNFFAVAKSMLDVTKKVIHLIPKERISDHWKEIAVPAYALRIMKYSIQILLTLVLISAFFLLPELIFGNFLAFTLSFIGIVESLIFASGYIYFRKLYRE